MEPVKIKTKEVSQTRSDLLTEQGSRCALCKMPCSSQQAVLDHDHKTGKIRGVLHRTCNGLLGKIENFCQRFGIPNLSAFLHGADAYLQKHATDQTGLVHPTFKTAEEKRIARNTKARKRRATKDSAC
jgi:hypothetical protein